MSKAMHKGEMSGRYLLSVVVPTRNRQKYALGLIEQIANFPNSNDAIQIVVTDNSDNDSLRDEVEKVAGKRNVKYLHIAERIPGVDNYAKAIELSEGEYVCCVGDDDAILPDLLTIAEWALGNGVDAVKFGAQASYVWPSAANGYMSSRLSLNRFSTSVSVVNVEDELISFLRSGCLDLPSAKIPKAYHGLVRRRLFDEIFKRTGRYCGGLSPDIYLSVSLALLLDNLICIDVPLTIFGACRQSTTGDSLNKTNVGRLEDAPHFVGQEYEWDELVPRYYCGANIWADSAMHALVDMGRADLKKHFSVEHIAAYGLAENPRYSDAIKSCLSSCQCDGRKVRKLVLSMRKQRRIRFIKDVLKNNSSIAKPFYRVRSAIRERKGDGRYVASGVCSAAEAANIVHERIVDCIPRIISALDLRVSGNGER